MPGKIQTQPRGLLATLGLKTTGVNADQWPYFVQPTIEQLPFYLLDSQEIVANANAAMQTTGNSVDLTVPNGEIWYLRTLGVGSTPLTAGDVPRGAFRIAQPVGADTTIKATQPHTITAALESYRDGMTFEPYVLLGPGWRAGFVLLANLAAAETFTATALINRVTA